MTRVDTLKKENAADRVIHINRGRFNKVSHNVFLLWEKTDFSSYVMKQESSFFEDSLEQIKIETS